MNGPTVEVSIPVPPGLGDELTGMLTVMGFEGFWEDGEILRAYIALERWDDEQSASLHHALAEFAAGHEFTTPTVRTQIIAPQNWNATWEASIQPVRATDRITVAPSWHPAQPAPGQIVLIIDPKMSFGTGHHETTRLMLQLLEPSVRQGCTLLDVGTGTGILAIAAVKLGAASATGVDIDEWSLENARENAQANGVAENIRILQGELADVPPGVYDIVAANIQRSVIEPLLPDLASRVARGGSLLLSGLLNTEREPMLVAFKRHALTVLEERNEQEWIAFALKTS